MNGADLAEDASVVDEAAEYIRPVSCVTKHRFNKLKSHVNATGELQGSRLDLLPSVLASDISLNEGRLDAVALANKIVRVRLSLLESLRR
jgi:hypothetical protein